LVANCAEVASYQGFDCRTARINLSIRNAASVLLKGADCGFGPRPSYSIDDKQRTATRAQPSIKQQLHEPDIADVVRSPLAYWSAWQPILRHLRFLLNSRRENWKWFLN
jgi:hypothetical protein